MEVPITYVRSKCKVCLSKACVRQYPPKISEEIVSSNTVPPCWVPECAAEFWGGPLTVPCQRALPRQVLPESHTKSDKVSYRVLEKNLIHIFIELTLKPDEEFLAIGAYLLLTIVKSNIIINHYYSKITSYTTVIQHLEVS